MPADFGPLNAHDTQRVYDQIAVLANMGLSEADIIRYLGQSQALGRSALDQYINQAGLAIGQEFQPQFEAGRNFLGANPLLADSGYANRLNRQLMTDLQSRLSGAYTGAASDFARGDVNYLQALQQQRAGLTSGLAGQAYNTILNPPQKRRGGFLGAVGQIGGAVAGGLLGGPAGAAAGYQAGGSLGGSGGYAPGFQDYRSTYGGLPRGGYSEPVGGPRRYRF